jgi:hypothetical protein
MMWVKILILVIFGLSAGFITACGYFAIFSYVGVLTRFIQYSNTAVHIYFYENVLILGVTLVVLDHKLLSKTTCSTRYVMATNSLLATTCTQ